jgi:hypothetical protein
MNDQSNVIVGAVIFAAILGFVGFWFGWSTLGWIFGATVVTFFGFALFQGLISR